MSNARFRGLGHVFSFTLGQMVKSRANIVSAVILLVMALVSVPLIQLTNGHGSVGPDVPAIVEQDGLTDAQRDILSSDITVITDDIAAPDEAPADELDGADDDAGHKGQRRAGEIGDAHIDHNGTFDGGHQKHRNGR